MASPGSFVSCSSVDDLSGTTGIVALAAAGVAVVALILAIVLAVRLRTVRNAQRAVLGDLGARDLVAHAADISDAVPRPARVGRRRRRRSSHDRMDDGRGTDSTAPSPTAPSCATTPTARCPGASRPRSPCSTPTAPASSCPRSTTATRRACTPSRSHNGRGEIDLSPEEAEAVRLALAEPRLGRSRPPSARDARRLPRSRGHLLARGAASPSPASTRSSSSRYHRLRHGRWRSTTARRPRLRPDRELARGVGQRHPGHARARDRRRGHRGRVRPPGAPVPDRPRGHRRSTGSRPSSPIRRRTRSAPASCAPSCLRPAWSRSTRPPRPCARSPSATAPTRRSARALAAELLRLRRAARRRRGRAGNETRFVWLAPARRGRRPTPDAAAAWKTSIVFWGAGAERPGWLVRCLTEFAERGVNLTQDRVAPAQARLGRYMFFLDSKGGVGDAAVADALEGLRGHVRARCASSARTRGAASAPDGPRLQWPRAGSPRPRTTLAQVSRPRSYHQAQWGPRRSESTGGADRERGRVLVLNATYEPINVCTVRRAVVLLLKDKAEVVEQRRRELHSERIDAPAARGHPPASPTCACRATCTGARSPAARCSPATAGPASTAARARASPSTT